MDMSLCSENLTLKLDSLTGQIVAVENAKTGETCNISLSEFSFTVDGKQRRTSVLPVCETTAEGAELTFNETGFCVVLHYQAVKNLPFFEYWYELTSHAGKTVRIDKVILSDIRVGSDVSEIIFHDDQSLWHVPTNYFARMKKGGFAAGLEYPYWENVEEGGGIIEKSAEQIILGYSPKYDLSDGETFTSEKAFLGVYQLTGKMRISAGAYPTKEKSRYYPGIFDNAGLNQHFVGTLTPEDAGLKRETLDWGEVFAMQDFFRSYLPEQKLPEDGYWIWQNGWWAGLFNADIHAIEPLCRADVHDLMTAAIYFGHANHPSTEPDYIKDMRTEPLGFPKIRNETGVQSGSNAWHRNEQKTDESAPVSEYTNDFHAPEAYEALITEARKKGVHISSFSTPNNAYPSRPDWFAVNEDGTAQEYFGTRLSCPACDEYMDFHFDMLSRVIDHSDRRFWAFDGRWLCYSEIAGYHFGKIGPLPCYNPDHGHPVGDGRYKEWKNIERFKAKLRSRYPAMCLEQYYGLKRGGVWSLSSLNSDENYYEMASPENNRFQTWHNENDRFRPTYLNYSSIFGTTASEFEHSLISSMSTSSYAQISKGYQALRDDPDCADILKRYKKWADDNYRFFKTRRCMFGAPGEKAVDGSAHIFDGEGILYFFTAPNYTVDARVRLDEMIGFREEENAAYRVTRITAVSRTGENSFCRIESDVLTFGDTLRAGISPDTAVMLKIEKAGSITGRPAKTDIGPCDVIADAF